MTIRVFDPDWNEMVVLSEAKPMKAGENIIHWNGKDRAGTSVPDEAYFFTVEAKSADGEVEICDPTAFSGGVENDLTKASIDRLAGTVRYRLPQVARVNMRIGISGGPLLRTVVDWKPRLAGEVTDYWDGKDSDKLFDLYEHQKSKLIITYFTLPENSVISYGNSATPVPGTVYLSRRDALIKLLNGVKVLNYGKDGQSCRASLSAPCHESKTGRILTRKKPGPALQDGR